MDLKRRNKQIRELRKKGKKNWSIYKLGTKFHLSAQRINEILHPIPTYYCRRHTCYYPIDQTCQFCKLDLYYSQTLPMTILLKRIRQISKHTRVAIYSYERKLLSKLLHSKYNLSSGFVGKLLNRDRTTIEHFLKLRS